MSTSTPPPESKLATEDSGDGHYKTDQQVVSKFGDGVSVCVVDAVLKYVGFNAIEKLSDTLQGEIWSVVSTESGAPFVVKIASKSLHENKTAIANNEAVKVHEDILKEASILKHLNNLPNCPSSIIGFHGFVYTESQYFLIMNHGGRSMLSFVMKAHTFIDRGQLSVQEWMKVVKLIFKQMVHAVDFMHRHNICHFDISLENMTLPDVPVLLQDKTAANVKHTGITFGNAEKNICARLVDFGLAEKFAVSESDKQCVFYSKKYCGKRNYQCPEIVNKRVFNAACNDIWCLGICLFMMTAGSAPWNIAHESDDSYSFFMHKRSLAPALLKQWNVLHYFDQNLLDLVFRIFQPECKRITMGQIKKHDWFLSM